ncbi:MAG TPA: hypothetical protein VLW51_02920 [Solirubrobacteraceae bacterium]|nr:hypothetical protein [Solirubrobacteraceae bacterium]
MAVDDRGVADPDDRGVADPGDRGVADPDDRGVADPDDRVAGSDDRGVAGSDDGPRRRGRERSAPGSGSLIVMSGATFNSASVQPASSSP